MIKEIILRTSLGEVEEDDEEYKPTEKEMKEELTQVLFEICEDWVLRGQEPEFEFK